MLKNDTLKNGTSHIGLYGSYMELHTTTRTTSPTPTTCSILYYATQKIRCLSAVFKIKCLITVFVYLNFWLVVFLVNKFVGRGISCRCIFGSWWLVVGRGGLWWLVVGRGGLWWLVCCFRNDQIKVLHCFMKESIYCTDHLTLRHPETFS